MRDREGEGGVRNKERGSKNMFREVYELVKSSTQLYYHLYILCLQQVNSVLNFCMVLQH